MTISRHIQFGTTKMLQNQKSKTILSAIKQVKSIYMKRGFKLDHILMDGQFEPLQAKLADMAITVNTISNDEHVPKIERHIQTTKERTRCVYNTLPFNKMPACMTIEMVYSSTFWLNSFPPANGVSKTISP
jgi:TPP-dependent 2-oxoacid decarboxylase